MFILKSLLADYTSVTLLGQHNGGTWHVKAVLEAQQQQVTLNILGRQYDCLQILEDCTWRIA